MRVANGKWFIASRDIYRATCDHCVKLALAVAAGNAWAKGQVSPFIETGDKIQFLQGNQYEDLRFEELRESLEPGLFLELEPRVDKFTVKKALDARIPVIAQAFLDADYGVAMLTGYADLLVREDYELALMNGKLTAHKLPGAPESSNYVPYDVKLSSDAKANHWHQVYGYYEALQQMGIASDRDLGIITKTAIVNKPIAECRDAIEVIRQPFFYFLENNSPQDAETWENLELHCPTPTTCDDIYCEYPKLCVQDRINLDMFTQLYYNGNGAAPKLQAAGIHTVAELAKLDPEQDIVGISKIASLITEAKLIINEKNNTEPKFLKKPTATQTIPNPTPGDIFFDLEWFNPLGLEKEINYIFGWVDAQGKFDYFEAHDLKQEKIVFEKFVAFALKNIEKYPESHIYHWHSPESKGLVKLANYYGILQVEVDQILKHMVDLRPIAIDRLWVGVGGYSLKQLEHYYQDDRGRDTDTKDGADSQVQYFKYQAAVEASKHEEAARILSDIYEYNEADCESTRGAYHWLRTFD
jgi:uncharacterized protein